MPCDEAARIGYPVMLKSTAGGGGIGMRLVRQGSELGEAFEAVERLARKNFSGGGLFLEKYIERARHIEVQIFGDGAGRVIALGERDCSTQRRNQKIIEETPAPGLSAALRQRLLECAIRLGRAVITDRRARWNLYYDTEHPGILFSGSQYAPASRAWRDGGGHRHRSGGMDDPAGRE